jgi:hypothetical protein
VSIVYYAGDDCEDPLALRPACVDCLSETCVFSPLVDTHDPRLSVCEDEDDFPIKLVDRLFNEEFERAWHCPGDVTDRDKIVVVATEDREDLITALFIKLLDQRLTELFRAHIPWFHGRVFAALDSLSGFDGSVNR